VFVQLLNACLFFYLLVSITNVLLRRAALHQLQAFVIVLLKVIYANLNVPPPVQQTLPPPPPSSQRVLFADKEGKQGVCKLVRKLHGTNKCIDSEANCQRGSAIGPATWRANYAGFSIRCSWNTPERAVPGVSQEKMVTGGGTKHY